MSIFVTGGTGFLGKQLIKELSHLDEDVHLLARKNGNVKDIDNKRLKIFQGDVTDIRTIRKAIKGCKTVFHMASLVKAWVRNPADFYKVNVEGLKNVMECALEENVTKFLYTSSFMAIGPSNGDLNTEKTQHDTDHLHNHYERTKYIADQLIPEYVNKGLPVITVYPCVIYGPGEITEGNLVVRIILDFLERKIPGILGDGSKLWNYAFITDVVKGHLLAMEKGGVGQKYILGGENVSMEDFFNLLEALSGIKAPKRHIPFWVAKMSARCDELIARISGKTPKHTPSTIEIYKHDWAFSSEKAEQELGYTHIPLKEGLERTLDWIHKTPGYKPH
ncbi:MAG TPA: SDR family oxidoreductase [Candidatus Wunengus sp. YC60]|uniref:SDR family oxidoreductase n=1 Tax=Candidatus Wunengus sp. YC60 TaxID=3367697 RepID=UPI0040293460